MEKIPLRLAQAGMILAQPVINAAGTALVGEGVVLSDALVERLTQAGISVIAVKSGPKKGPGTADRVLGRLEHLFRKQSAEPFMAALKSMLHDYFERKSAEGKIGSQSDEPTT